MRFFGFLLFLTLLFFFFAENNFVNCHLAGREAQCVVGPSLPSRRLSAETTPRQGRGQRRGQRRRRAGLAGAGAGAGQRGSRAGRGGLEVTLPVERCGEGHVV